GRVGVPGTWGGPAPDGMSVVRAYYVRSARAAGVNRPEHAWARSPPLHRDGSSPRSSTDLSPVNPRFLQVQRRRWCWSPWRPDDTGLARGADGSDAGVAGGVAASGRAAHPSILHERQQIRIDHVCVCRAHAVRELLVDLERAVLEQLHRLERRVRDRHDLVVITVQGERRHLDGLQVIGEVRLGERGDAVVVRFRAAHHCLPPPVPHYTVRRLRAGAVEPVEWPARKPDVELCAATGELLAQAVEYFLLEAVRIR